MIRCPFSDHCQETLLLNMPRAGIVLNYKGFPWLITVI